MVEHLEGIKEFSSLPHQVGQVLVDVDLSAIRRVLVVVLLDVFPNKSHELRSGGPLFSGDVGQDLVSLDSLQDVFMSFVGAHDDLRFFQKNLEEQKRAVWTPEQSKEE